MSEDASSREKSRSLKPLWELGPFLKPYRTLIALAGAALLLTASVSLILPFAARRIIDSFAADSLADLDLYFGAAFAMAGILAAGSATRYFLVSLVGERVVADIRKSVFGKMLGMSPEFFESIMTGEVLSRITTDTTLILSVIGSSVSLALRNALIFAGGLALMFATAPKLAGQSLVLVPLVTIPIILLGRKIRRLSAETQERTAQSSGNASEILLSLQTVQAFTHERESAARFNGLTELSFRVARKRILSRAIMTAIVIFLVFSGVAFVLWGAAEDVVSGGTSVGELVQFLIYAVMVAGSIGALSEVWGELQRAAGAAVRIAELLRAGDSVRDPEKPRALPPGSSARIAFEGVCFEYPSRRDRRALENVSFEVRPGETVALVGPSGAGKSTVLQLLLRFFDPGSGVIRLNGIPLHEMARADFRSAMALVPQDPVIFAGSAHANIEFGRPGASREEVARAAKAAAAHEFISELPDGYDSYLGERGIMLSGGQKQRIAIARAILRDAPALLLDEATSSLDSESEAAVQKAVDTLSRDRTTLIIAHRLATVKKADRIIVLDRGSVVAQGTHDSLIRGGGVYARLARLQFTG